jgi:hypothetical protein
MQNFEEWLAFISTHLPQPVVEEQTGDGAIFTGGDPGEVIVRLTQATITVLEYAVEWRGPHAPVLSPRRIGTVVWRRAPVHEMTKAVAALIEAAREARRAKFRICEMCERSMPPEWMHDDLVCQSCAENDLGLVH